jgi:hypothetical protein
VDVVEPFEVWERRRNHKPKDNPKTRFVSFSSFVCPMSGIENCIKTLVFGQKNKKLGRIRQKSNTKM